MLLHEEIARDKFFPLSHITQPVDNITWPRRAKQSLPNFSACSLVAYTKVAKKSVFVGFAIAPCNEVVHTVMHTFSIYGYVSA